jgi:hypothetical protein
MQVLSLLAEPFRENGYTLAIHGSVPAQGKGRDLDLIAVPAALAVTQPEIMERLMCELLRASPDGEPSGGLLGDWSRACILEDGHQIDMQYRPLDWEGAIRQLAYRLWQERGQPLGSPEVDWSLAEHRLSEARCSLIR